MIVFGFTSVSPKRDFLEDHIVGVEGEFNVRKGSGRCVHRSLDCMERRQFSGIDVALFCNDVQLDESASVSSIQSTNLLVIDHGSNESVLRLNAIEFILGDFVTSSI